MPRFQQSDYNISQFGVSLYCGIINIILQIVVVSPVVKTNEDRQTTTEFPHSNTTEAHLHSNTAVIHKGVSDHYILDNPQKEHFMSSKSELLVQNLGVRTARQCVAKQVLRQFSRTQNSKTIISRGKTISSQWAQTLKW